MFDSDAVQQGLDLLDAKFAVERRDSNQLASGELLRRATLVDVNVRRLRADNRVM